MSPYDSLRGEIVRAGNIKCRRLCREAGLNVNKEEMKQEFVKEVMEKLDSFRFTFNGVDDFDYGYLHTSSIANEIVARVNKSVFNPIRDEISDEVDDMIDLLYSRPCEEDMNKILNYIKENTIECSE